MSQIIPTVLTDDPAQFASDLIIFKTFSKRVQIDFSDGTFASSNTVGFANMQIPPEMVVDMHMMTAKPSQYIQNLLNMKPNLVIFHAEVDDNLLGLMQQLHGAGIKAGVALLKGTLPRRVENLIINADHVLVFAGALGAQGGAIDMMQIEKVPLIRAIKGDVEIGWDGGANLSNVRALAHADIDVINVGSAISKASDKAAMYQSLIVESEKKGVLV